MRDRAWGTVPLLKSRPLERLPQKPLNLWKTAHPSFRAIRQPRLSDWGVALQNPLQDNEKAQADESTEPLRAREELERTREELDKRYGMHLTHGSSNNGPLEKLAARGQVPSQPTKRLTGSLQGAPAPYCPRQHPDKTRVPEGAEGLLGAPSKGNQIPSTQLPGLLLLGQPQLLLQISVDAHAAECQQHSPGGTGRSRGMDAVVLEDERGSILRNPTSLTPRRYVSGVKPLRQKGSRAWKGILVSG